MSVRTTNATQRLDMMLAQAERFLANGLRGEALARARQLLVQADLELESQGLEAHPAIETRRILARRFLEEHRIDRARHG
ncbi:MAG: hypothetical protein K1X94_05255 [Sandaracinaceae bacterium]|jgi:hypothetical protein|nr:hypothetical protein [Sandaracinaceae bacterium]